ncbi:MAG: hypothetical protein NT059_05095 [Planctomycetota bacterium]|nr:hypothetical protein [Planctomycetota bacterium]
MVKVSQFVGAKETSVGVHSQPAARPRKRSSSARSSIGESAGMFDSTDEYLSRVLELLSHHERMALRLRHRDGLTPDAVAARMHLPETIVRDLIDTAERTIRAAQRVFIEAMVEASNASRSSRLVPLA